MPTPRPAFGTFRLRARPPSSQSGDPSTTKWAKISGTQGPIASLRRSTSDRTHTVRAPRRSPHITATDRFVALGNRSFLGRTIVAESRFPERRCACMPGGGRSQSDRRDPWLALPFESWVERDFLISADRDRSVIGIPLQPFTVRSSLPPGSHASTLLTSFCVSGQEMLWS